MPKLLERRAVGRCCVAHASHLRVKAPSAVQMSAPDWEFWLCHSIDGLGEQCTSFFPTLGNPLEPTGKGDEKSGPVAQSNSPVQNGYSSKRVTRKCCRG